MYTSPRLLHRDDALDNFASEDRDVSADPNHLTIAGLRKYAEIAWSAMPDAIKEHS